MAIRRPTDHSCRSAVGSRFDQSRAVRATRPEDPSRTDSVTGAAPRTRDGDGSQGRGTGGTTATRRPPPAASSRSVGVPPDGSVPATAMTRRRTERRPQPRDRGALMVYTAATHRRRPRRRSRGRPSPSPSTTTISLTAAGGREGILLGLIFWIAIGLLGGTRVERMHGHGVLTFHLPFIIAAMAARRAGRRRRGSPWSPPSSARELREVPWYGTVANHAALTLVGGRRRRRPRSGSTARWARCSPTSRRRRQLIAIIGGGARADRDRRSAWRRGPSILRDGLTRQRGWRASTTTPTGPPRPPRSSSAGSWPTPTPRSAGGRRWSRRSWCSPSGRATTPRRSSHHDPMTGLLNRSGFDVRLSRRSTSASARTTGSARCWPSTSTASRRSTTATATRPATRSSARSASGLQALDPAHRRRGPARRRRVRGPARATCRTSRPPGGSRSASHDAIARPMDIDGRALQVGASDRGLPDRAHAQGADDRAGAPACRPADVRGEGGRWRRPLLGPGRRPPACPERGARADPLTPVLGGSRQRSSSRSRSISRPSCHVPSGPRS